MLKRNCSGPIAYIALDTKNHWAVSRVLLGVRGIIFLSLASHHDIIRREECSTHYLSDLRPDLFISLACTDRGYHDKQVSDTMTLFSKRKTALQDRTVCVDRYRQKTS